jgi:hypothetical protein
MRRFCLAAVAFVVGSVCSPMTLSAQDSYPVKTGSQPPDIACNVGWTPLSGAGWDLCYRNTSNHGIEISPANFHGKSVIFAVSQPFVLVPYRGHNPRYKDGLGATCGGAAYSFIPGTLSAGVFVDDENPGFPAFGGYPAAPAYTKLEVSGIYHSGWYRYRQVFRFHGNGDVELLYGFGGYLAPPGISQSHFHSPYWRIDLDVDVSFPNYFEQFSHTDLNSPDVWDPVLATGGILGDPSIHQKWRVRSDVVNAQGQFHSWEIETVLGNPTEYSSASVWPMSYKGWTPATDGTTVGTSVSNPCSDWELQNDSFYANSGLDDISAGDDLVIWAQATHYHEIRNLGEEIPRIPGFEYVGVSLRPRNFENTTP